MTSVTVVQKYNWIYQQDHQSVSKFSCSVVFASLGPHGLQHARLPCPSPTPGAYSNSCPLSRGCHPTTSPSVVPFCSLLQSVSTSGAFPVSQFFASGGQIIGASALVSVLPMNTQDWFPVGWTGWISLQSMPGSRHLINLTLPTHSWWHSYSRHDKYKPNWLNAKICIV